MTGAKLVGVLAGSFLLAVLGLIGVVGVGVVLGLVIGSAVMVARWVGGF